MTGGLSALAFALALETLHPQPSLPSDSLLFGLLMAFLAGAGVGAIAGSFSGLSIGLVLCRVQRPVVGILLGSVAGLILSMILQSGPATLTLTVQEAWLFRLICVGSGSAAGFFLTCVLLRSRRSW